MWDMCCFTFFFPSELESMLAFGPLCPTTKTRPHPSSYHRSTLGGPRSWTRASRPWRREPVNWEIAIWPADYISLSEDPAMYKYCRVCKIWLRPSIWAATRGNLCGTNWKGLFASAKGKMRTERVESYVYQRKIGIFNGHTKQQY